MADFFTYLNHNFVFCKSSAIIFSGRFCRTGRKTSLLSHDEVNSTLIHHSDTILKKCEGGMLEKRTVKSAVHF